MIDGSRDCEIKTSFLRISLEEEQKLGGSAMQEIHTDKKFFAQKLSDQLSVPPSHQKRLYLQPDYALVFDKDSRKAVMQELKSLRDLKGCYYEFLSRANDQDDDRLVVVFYFEDSLINAKAEQLKILTQLKNYDCQVPFRVAAKNKF